LFNKYFSLLAEGGEAFIQLPEFFNTCAVAKLCFEQWLQELKAKHTVIYFPSRIQSQITPVNISVLYIKKNS
jgi:hypothetical protein